MAAFRHKLHEFDYMFASLPLCVNIIQSEERGRTGKGKIGRLCGPVIGPYLGQVHVWIQVHIVKASWERCILRRDLKEEREDAFHICSWRQFC